MEIDKEYRRRIIEFHLITIKKLKFKFNVKFPLEK